MPDDDVRIENGYHLIDAHTWVAQRTGPPLGELTDALREFIRHPVFDQHHPRLGVAARMQLWCAAHGWTVGDESTYHHDHDCLDRPVTVVLAAGPDTSPRAHRAMGATVKQAAYALVQVGHHPPQVHHDVVTDDGYWLQVEPVEIRCPAGHRWTWLDRAELLTADGFEVSMAALFGHDPGAPYAECRVCVAFDAGVHDEPCPCDGRRTIYCPTCGQRCRLTLPEIATMSSDDRTRRT